LKEDFDHYFNEFDSFSIQVGEHQLFYRGQVVYESKDVKESLAFVFFRDGIREIRFLKGLESQEMIDFLNVVRKSDAVNRMEDDLITLLWEKDFSHIAFTTIDVFLEGSATFLPATEQDLTKGLEYRGSGGGGIEGAVDEAETKDSHVGEVEGLKQVLNPSPGQSLVEACQLNPDERLEINREIQQEHEPEYLLVWVDNLVEILLHLSEDMDAYVNMISYFDRVIEYLLDQGKVGKAVVIVEKLKDTMESMVLKDKQVFAIRSILEKLSSSHSIELLGKALKGNGEVESESILQYLRFLTKQAIQPLCHLLGELKSEKWRKGICDALAELSQEDIYPLAKLLSDRNPVLVSSILYILKKIGHPSTVKYLGNLVTHANQKVREETLQVLSQFGGKGIGLIQKFLKDPEPEIRAKASLLLARMAKDQAVNPLLEIILSKDFYKRDHEEKVSFFKALGETGSKEAIPILQKIAKKRNWFIKGKWEDMRLCAANTLKMIGA
jgi:hypothetical protein